MKKSFLSLLLSGLAALSHAAGLQVLACEPEWGALVQALAADKVQVYTATTAMQDPHHIQARPSLIAAVRNADLLVCTGAELETGWLPVLQNQSGNRRVQVGQPGYFEAAAHVSMLEVPSRLDRSDGDVHAAGNPHIQTDARNIARVADALAKRLAAIDPANAAYYAARYTDFSARWQAAIANWEKMAAPLRGMPIVVQHKAFPYLQAWLGLKEIAALEPKPGVEPSSAHLASVLKQVERMPAKFIMRTPYDDNRPADWLAARAKIPAIVLPFTVGGNAQATDLFSLFDSTLSLMLEAAR